MSGALFWVGGGGLGIILGRWGRVRVGVDDWGWVGVGLSALFDNAH